MASRIVANYCVSQPFPAVCIPFKCPAFARGYAIQAQNRPIQFVSLNCYLVPKLFTFKIANATCRRQDERALRIARFVRGKDVIALQEMWGGHVNDFTSALLGTHNLVPGARGVTFGELRLKLVNTVRSWLAAAGGLWFAFRKPLRLLHSGKHTFTISESRSRKGVGCVLLDMEPYWPGRQLLVFNTHLDPTDLPNRRAQLAEIQDFIGKTVRELLGRRGGFEPAKCGVVCTGDFNTAADWPDQYAYLLRVLGARDLYAEQAARQAAGAPGSLAPHTYDMANSLATKIATKQSRRIDYIFALDHVSDFGDWNPDGPVGDARRIEFMRLACDQFVVERQPFGEEFSDHWPQTAVLRPAE
eukprot:TRINITY_DN22800_c0_g1_i1.p2 TRINITY_DN22800_c0_g1~~TRINITY_DN22800_c0_g1_i1.p2  ORF type:complete len:382 (+),score=99.35 TRINITY_DN22800_c0_g1_i1:75-1148(+)